MERRSGGMEDPLCKKNNDNNRIYNTILDRDWFSARLFVTQSARNHVGVRLQVSDLSNRTPVIAYPRDFHVNYARFNGFLSNVFYSFQNLGSVTAVFAQ